MTALDAVAVAASCLLGVVGVADLALRYRGVTPATPHMRLLAALVGLAPAVVLAVYFAAAPGPPVGT